MTHGKSTRKRINVTEFSKPMVQTYLLEYLDQETSSHIGALPYERTSGRRDHRNGYKPRRLNTRVEYYFYLFLRIEMDHSVLFNRYFHWYDVRLPL